MRDLNYLQKLLERIHPNLYAHRSRKEVRRRFKAILNSVGAKKSNYDHYILIQKMLAVACDEHTNIDLSDRFADIALNRPNLPSLSFIVTKDALLIDDFAIPKESSRVVSIDGIDHSKLSGQIRSLISSDGCIDDSPQITKFNGLGHSALVSLSLPFKYWLQVTIESKSNDTRHSFRHSGRGLRELYRNYSNLSWLDRALPLKELNINEDQKHTVGLYNKARPGLFFAHDPQWKYVYIHSSHFLGGKKAEAEMDTIMREIIKNNPEHVILDLSINPGGRIQLASRLLSYFLSRSHLFAQTVYRRTRRIRADKNFVPYSKERLQVQQGMVRQFRRAKRRNGRYTLNVRRRSFGHPSFKGKLTVLVSPLTRSAATLTALVLKKQRNATIVGYQNGGSTTTSCFAANGTYALPVSKVKVAIPDTCYKRVRVKGQRDKRLIPDIRIDPLARPSKAMLRAIVQAGVDHVLNKNATSQSLQDSSPRGARNE